MKKKISRASSFERSNDFCFLSLFRTSEHSVASHGCGICISPMILIKMSKNPVVPKTKSSCSSSVRSLTIFHLRFCK